MACYRKPYIISPPSSSPDRAWQKKWLHLRRRWGLRVIFKKKGYCDFALIFGYRNQECVPLGRGAKTSFLTGVDIFIDHPQFLSITSSFPWIFHGYSRRALQSASIFFFRYDDGFGETKYGWFWDSRRGWVIRVKIGNTKSVLVRYFLQCLIKRNYASNTVCHIHNWWCHAQVC